MLPSTSVEKLHNDKKQKKRYQKFKANQDKYNSNDGKIASPVMEKDTSEKISGFVDLKDFPELKASVMQNKSLFETNSRFKDDKPWQFVTTKQTKTKLNAAFPPLVNSENLKKNDISSSKRKDNVGKTVSEICIQVSENELGAEKQSNKNHKENKAAIKKIPTQPQRNPKKKKRSEPVFINFQDILASNKIQKKTDRKHQKLIRNKVQRLKERELLSGNFLDSSNPKRNRGKHREIKKKKLSHLKMTIIKERIIKSKIREKAVTAQFGSSSINLLDKIDFNAEIKIYLNELNNKKLKQIESRKGKVFENINTDKINNKEKDKDALDKADEQKKNSEIVSLVGEKIIPQTTAEGEIKFTTKFREYCDNIITPNLNSAVAKLIEELIKLQDRLFLRDPIKAKARKRHVSGIREVRKYLCLKKVKMIIIAPNLEKLQMEGSVYDSVNELKSIADSQSVPYGFALDRYKLGRCTRKNVPVSAFAILSYEGIEALYENALHELMDGKKKFSEMAKPKIVKNSTDVNSKVLSTLVSAFEEVLKMSNEIPSEEK